MPARVIRIKRPDRRHEFQFQQADEPNAQFEARVNPQRMQSAFDEAGNRDAPNAHAAHETPQQQTQGYRGQPNDQLQHLVPDDFVNQRGTTAADKQNQH